MKFIRDIIAEKRNATPAASIPSEIEEVIYPSEKSEDGISAETVDFDDAGFEDPSDHVATDDDAEMNDEAPSAEAEEEAPIDDQISGLLETLNRQSAAEPEQDSHADDEDEVPLETELEAALPDEELVPESVETPETQNDAIKAETASTFPTEEDEEIAGPSEEHDPETSAVSPIGMLKRTPPPTETSPTLNADLPRKRPGDLTRSTTRLHRSSEELAAESHPESMAQTPEPVTPVAVPRPASTRSGGRSGRVKTRILGFSGSDSQTADPFAQDSQSPVAEGAAFPVGWLIVVDGPGRGTAITLHDGVSQIGRGESQAVRLDFGDTSISRENHAAIAFDSEQSEFFIGHGGKANLVRLNNQPVLSTQKITSRDMIRIGETTLRFVGLCGPDFSWREK